MKKMKMDLEKVLTKKFESIILDTDKCNSVYDYAYNVYDIPRVLSSDIVCFRMDISEVSEFVLFCLADSLNRTELGKINLEEFFTDLELKTYPNEKFIVEKIKFPIKIKMLEVEQDQWIGKTDINFLMLLRDAQLINYNINAQRTMHSIVQNGEKIYKITLNDRAVNSIKEHLEDSSFIPNTITLNIPMDEESDFIYDEENSELIIKSLAHFDILDGYHRYIAAGKVKDNNKDFDYNFELRIVNFTDDKAKSFIFQEDQKTKMKKLDSMSFDMNNTANIIVERLNNNSMFNLMKQISRNDGLINFGELASLVQYLFVKRGDKYKNKNLLIMNTVKLLTEEFNALTEYDEKYYEHYNYRKLSIIICMFYIYRHEDKTDMVKRIDNILETVDSFNSKAFTNRNIGTILKETLRLDREVNG